MEEVAEEYRSSLAELNFNSKPHINMLTMLAEENIKHAPSIVQTIVEHIKSVSPDMMLPCMYLVDSIIKNIGKIYVQLFSKHLVAIFTSVFEKVDETVRSALYKLRSTWTGIFPNALLLRLDKSVVLMDPAWPILAQPPATKIHVNPKFLDKTTAQQLPKREESPPTSQSSLLQEANAIKKKQLEVLQVLQAKKKQLMELKKKAQASGVVEYLGSDVQKALNARDPRLIKKAPVVDATVLQSVVVVPKVPIVSSKKDETAQVAREKRSASPEAKKLKTEESDTMLKEDLRNKLNDIKNSTAIVEKNLNNDKMIVVGNKNKRKHSVSSDRHIVPPPKINNKNKVPLTESDTLQSTPKIVNLSNESINHIVPNTKIPPPNTKQTEDLYSNSHRVESSTAPVLFGNEDKDYRTLIVPKQDPNPSEIVLKEPPFPKSVAIPVVKSFKLDNKDRKVYFVSDRCFVVMEDNIPRELSFEGPPKLIFVEGLSKPFELGFGGHEVKFEIDGKWNTIRFGTPAREVYINNYPCEAQFGGQPLAVVLENGKLHRIHISGPPPQVILKEKPAYELYEKFCQSNQEFLSRYNSLSNVAPEIQSASRDVDMRVISNKFQPTIFNFPLEKVNDVDWQRMSVDSTQAVWNAPKNAFETFKESSSNIVSVKNYPDSMPDWPKTIPVSEVANQIPPALPPPMPPKELLERFPLAPRTASTSELPTTVPVSNAVPFPQPNYTVPPLNPQINKVQLSNTPRLSPPPLPPFLPPVPSSTCMSAPYVNTVVTAPVPMTNIPPNILAPNLQAPIPIQAPISRPCLLPTPVNTLPNPMSMQNMPNPIEMTIPLPMGIVPNPIQVTSSITAPPVPEAPAPPPVNMDIFLKKLIDAGIIGKKGGSSASPTAEIIQEEVNRKVEPIPRIRLLPKALKEYHPGVISMLHVGSQCATCGMRFKEIQSEQYSRHLDWHFRMNRREKDGAKKPFSRRLFYEIKDWIQFKEFEEKDERAPSYFELQASGEQLEEEKPETLCSVPSSECESENCAVCGEQFQLFWVEDEEEWHLRNAVKHDDQVYHPACYEDFKKANDAANLELDTSVEEAAVEPESEKPDVEAEKMEEEPEKPATETEEKIAVKQEPGEAKPTVTKSDSDAVKVKEEPMEIEVAQTENKITKETSDTKMETDVVVKDKEEESEESKLEKSEEPKPEKSEEPKSEKSEEPKPEKSEETKPEKSETKTEKSDKTETKISEETKTEKSEETELEKSKSGKEEESKSIVSDISKEQSKPSETIPVQTGGEEEEEVAEFRPPTPDPRFEVLEPVFRGTELSALCTIM